MSDASLLFQCFSCGSGSSACPDCVVTVRVDPLTGMPPDVAVVDGRYVPTEPSAEATARSRKEPICDNCVKARNELNSGQPAWATSAETHRRRHL